MIIYVDMSSSNMSVSLFDLRGNNVQDITTSSLGLIKSHSIFNDYFVILLSTFLRSIKINSYNQKYFNLKFNGIYRKSWASNILMSFLSSSSIKLYWNYIRVLNIPHNGCRLSKNRS